VSDRDIDPPSRTLQFGELAAGWEYAGCVAQLGRLRQTAPKGSGEPVVVLPGFMADDLSTFLLRTFLSSIGYRVSGWGLGRSIGRMLDFLEPMVERIESKGGESGTPVKLVGWSRGGVLSREIARDRPDLVDQVVTLASPVKGGASATSIRSLVEQQTGLDAEALRSLMRQRNERPIDVPITALYSKTDGVVAWQACIDNTNPNVTHHEVRATHTGIGVNADAYRIVAKALAE
jgi:hypothetical protein